VASEAHRRFINVPSSQAQALHAYLRGHRVHSAPPEPLCSGTDNIELARGVDVAAVQALLDCWA
jgi:hypothetical protein